MKDSITIRKADSIDLEILFDICRRAYSENFATHWNEGGLEWYLDKVYGKRGIASDLESANVQYFLAFVNEVAAGFMKLNTNSQLPHDAASFGVEIEKIYFLKKFQDMGLGKSLINIALKLARDSNKEIWLGVIDTNEPAMNLYEKLGFTKHDKIRLDIPYFKDELRGMWRMIMKG